MISLWIEARLNVDSVKFNDKGELTLTYNNQTFTIPVGLLAYVKELTINEESQPNVITTRNIVR